MKVSPYHEEAQQVIEWLAGSAPAKTLNEGRMGGRLSPKEIAHYTEVRSLMHQLAKFTLGVLATGLGALVFLRPSRPVWRLAQSYGLVIWLVLTAFALLLAWWDWKVFFAWLHQPWFGSTSWRLPSGSLSLKMFPARFWLITFGGAILAPGLVFGGAWGLLCLGWRKNRTKSGDTRPENPAKSSCNGLKIGADGGN